MDDNFKIGDFVTFRTRSEIISLFKKDKFKRVHEKNIGKKFKILDINSEFIYLDTSTKNISDPKGFFPWRVKKIGISLPDELFKM